MHRSYVCLGLLVLLGCGAARTAHESGSDAGRRAPSFRAAEAPLPGLSEDLARLEQPSNQERLAALRSILRERAIEHQVRSFPNPRQVRDPRDEGHNVVITLGSGERDILLGAHYDAARLRDGSLSPGMVDNGAATIVLTRAVEALRDRRLRHRVLVVFFDLEEIGLVGSRAFVRASTPDRLAAMINVDVAAYGDAVIYGPAIHEGNERLYAGMKRVCGRLLITCVEFPRYPPSDYRSFQAAGVPNISLSVLPRVEAHQLWLMMNGGEDAGLREDFRPAVFHIIHSPDDTLERVDANAMTLAYNAVVALALELDRALP